MDGFLGRRATARTHADPRQRGGQITGARNIPWAQAVNEDGTLKSADELKATYEPKGVTPETKVITYCRMGERSSHTWFVLKYLLGYPDVRNYDGSWPMWGTSCGRRSRSRDSAPAFQNR